MKNLLKKTLSVMLCIMLLATGFIMLVPESVIPASAATYRTGANGAHSTYVNSKYYTHYTKLPITGDGRTDVIAFALSQLGYQESSSSSDMNGIGGGYGNNTEFNYNMGNWGDGYAYEWCATFCSWALYQSRNTDQNGYSDWVRHYMGNKNYLWCEVGCVSWANQLRQLGYFQRSKAYNGNTYKPQSGDLIFYCWDGPTGGEDHIGLVVYSDNNYVYTIEGNTSNQSGLEADGGGVYFKKYSLDYYYITGYGVLPYKTNSSVKKIDYSGNNPSTGLYISNVSKYIYSSETATNHSYTSERFSMFEVVGIASNGRLKVKGIKTTSGAVVDGYILNNTDRVIQLTTTTVAQTPKELLAEAIDNAESARYDQYTEENLATLRAVYEEAVALSKTTATDATLKTMTTKLTTALNNTVASSEKIVSKGKTYYVPDGGRTDIYVDDGKRLTDGAKTENNGGTDKFSGFNSTKPIEVIVDLGSSVKSNVYRIYTASHSGWGISLPPRVDVSVSDEKNGTYTAIGATTIRSATYQTDGWSMFTMGFSLRTYQTARYVKFTITNGSNHIWLQEVEVACADLPATDRIYVSGIDTRVTAGDTIIFTPKVGTITTTDQNHSYTTNVIATKTSEPNKYVVKSITTGTGTDTPSITLASNEILIAGHEWEGGTDNPIIGSRYNVQRIKGLSVGDELVLVGIDVANKSTSAAPTIEIVKKQVEEPPVVEPEPDPKPEPEPEPDPEIARGDVNEDGVIDQFDYILVKRHYFETRILVGNEFVLGDVNKDGVVDQFDYILISRHYFGSYKIG